ncbi:MAG: hypothetical protein AB7O92_04025 [Acidimicrobiia bacterium]
MRTAVRQYTAGWMVPLAVLTAAAGWWVGAHGDGHGGGSAGPPVGTPIVHLRASDAVSHADLVAATGPGGLGAAAPCVCSGALEP